MLGFFVTTQKNRNAVHCQGSRQPIEDGGEQRVQIRFRAELPAELDQGAAVVIDRAIKSLIDAILNPFAHRIKQKRGNDDSQDPSQRPGAGLPHVDQRGYSGYQREIHSRYRRCGQGINHAPLENQVNVHQAVAEDGVAERERQQSQQQD